MRPKDKRDGNHGKGGMVSGNARYNRAKAKRAEKPTGADRTMAQKHPR